MPVDIAVEKAQLDAAPPIQLLPPVGRCSFCGRLAQSLQLVEVIGGQERFKCELCAGGRHG